jgi:hypothetical protein
MSIRSLALVVSVAALAATGPGSVAAATPPVPGSGTSVQAGAPPTQWGPVKTLASNPRGQSIAVDTHSTTTVVWATSSFPSQIVALRRTIGAGWGDPEVIGRGYAPQVEVDARGDVTVVWITQRPGYTDGVASARRPSGGQWSDPARLSRDVAVPGYPDNGESPYGAAEVDLAVSPSGTAVVAWEWGSDDRDKPWRIQSVVRPSGGLWGQVVDVTPPSGAKDPQLGIGATNSVTLVYGHQRFGHPRVLKTRQRLARGWTDASVIAPESSTETLMVDAVGNALVVFTPASSQVRAIRRDTDGRWRTARTLSPEGVSIGDFAAAMNRQGDAMVVLGRDNGQVDVIQRPRRGQWSAPVRAARPGTTVYDVLAALNRSGDLFVGWGGHALYGKYQPAAGSWSERFTLSPDAGAEVLEETFAEVAPNGDVIVMWKQEARPLKVRVMAAS